MRAGGLGSDWKSRVRPGRRPPTGGLDALGAGQHGLSGRENPGACSPGYVAPMSEV